MEDYNNRRGRTNPRMSKAKYDSNYIYYPPNRKKHSSTTTKDKNNKVETVVVALKDYENNGDEVKSDLLQINFSSSCVAVAANNNISILSENNMAKEMSSNMLVDFEIPYDDNNNNNDDACDNFDNNLNGNNCSSSDIMFDILDDESENPVNNDVSFSLENMFLNDSDVEEGAITMVEDNNMTKKDDTFDEYQPTSNDEDNDEDNELLELEKIGILPNHYSVWKDDILPILSKRLIKLPRDDDEPIVKDFPGIKVGDLARDLTDFIDFHGINKSAESHLMNLLQKSFPFVKLPIKLTKNGNYKSSLSSYSQDAFKLLQYDMCSAGCIVYAGEYSNLRQCPTCSSFRYRPCSHHNCLNSQDMKINCNHANRTPYHRIYYRPITPLLVFLLKQPGFLLAVGYLNRNNNNDQYADISDGAEYKKHINEMHEKFQKVSLKQPKLNLVEVSLCFSEFYDGVQLFKTKTSNFWPLLFTILNLPPSYRNKVGVGTFCLSNFSGIAGSIAEEFLFKKCFVAELEILYKGITIKVDDKVFFIQARLILHVWDSKALEKELFVQGSGSYGGCTFCKKSGNGWRRKDSISKLCYIGHRILLPKNNYLRDFGQSRNCCPPTYYDAELPDKTKIINKKKVKIDNYDIRMAQFNPVTEPRQHPTRTNLESGNFTPCDQTMFDYERLRNSNNYQFFNEKYCDKSDFDDYLYYHHSDYRSQIFQELRTDEEYRKDAELFLENQNLYFRPQGVKKLKHVNGVKGLCHFALLPYFRFEVNGFDPFHGFYDTAKSYFALLKGLRPEHSCGIVKFCQMTGSHPYIKSIKTNKEKVIITEEGDVVEEKKIRKKKNEEKVLSPNDIPWLLSQEYQDKFDAWCSCILVPTGYASTFNFTMPFRRSGNLTGDNLFTIFTALIDFMMHSVSYIPKAYKTFFHLYSVILNDVLSPVQSDRQIDNLYWRTLELVCLNEGLLPISESIFMFHTLICIIKRIKLYGPVHGFWAYGGERSLPEIKKYLPKGGRSHDLTIIKRYNQKERSVVKSAYDFTVNDINNCATYKNKIQQSMNDKSKVFVENDRITYDDQSFHQLDPIKKDNFELNDYELNCLLLCLIDEIRKKTMDIDEAIVKSSLFRLYFRYKNLFECKNETFLKSLQNIKNKHDSITSLRSYLNKDKSELRKSLLQGEVFHEDYLIICNKIICIKEFIDLYQSGYVYGKQLRSKGVQFKETTPNLNINDIKERWWMKRFYSSWCKIRRRKHENRHTHSPFARTKREGCHIYGQINFFFNINIEEEILLHKVPFVSMAAYKTTLMERINIIFLNEESKLNNLIFASASDLYSTVILTVAFDSLKKPKRYHTDTVDPKFVDFISSTPKNDISHLVLLDLYPYRKRICFKINSQNNYNIKT